MGWNSDGTYTWSKSGETVSAAQMKVDYNMSQPTPKQSSSSQPSTQQTPSQQSTTRLGIQSDGTYVTPSGLVIPKEYAEGAASGRPYRINQSNGAMTIQWLDESPFNNKPSTYNAGSQLGNAMLAGAANTNQSTDPTVSFQDQSGKTFAEVSSQYGVDDVQVQQIYLDRSGNEYATVTSSIAGGTKLAMKQSPQIAKNIYLTPTPVFEKNTDLNNTQVFSMAQEARYQASVPQDKILLSQTSPLSIFGIGGQMVGKKLFPNTTVTSLVDTIPRYVSEKIPETPNKTWENIVPWSATAVASLPSFAVGAVNTANIYAVKLFTPTVATQKQTSLKESYTLGLKDYTMYDFDRNVLGIMDAVAENPTKSFVSMLSPAFVLGGVGIASGRVSGVVRTIGREKLPLEQYGYAPEVGYPITPTPTSAKNILTSFEKNTLIPKPIKMSKQETVPYVPKNAILPNTKLTGTERLMYTGWETDAPVGINKRYTLPTVTSSETSGMYGAPVAQTSYTKISTKMSEAIANMVGADLSNPFSKKPTVLATTVGSIEAVPKSLRNKIGSKEYIETKSKPGVAYADLYKSEYQSILASGQEIEVTGKNYYFKTGGIGKENLFGKRIPITEQRTTGKFTPLESENIITKSKKSDYSYDPYKKDPILNTAYVKSISSPVQTKEYKSYVKSKISTPSITKYKSTSKITPSSIYKSSTSKLSTSNMLSSITSIKTTPSRTYKSSTSKITNSYSSSKSSPSISSISGISSKTTPSITSKTTPSITNLTYKITTPSTISYNTPSYRPPKYTPPKYKPPVYKTYKFKPLEEKPRKIKYKSANLFGFKERTKSRSVESILGVSLKKTPEKRRRNK